jgi:hypothetical protein
MDSNAIQAGAEHLWPPYHYTDPSPSYIEEYTDYLLAFVQQLVNNTVPWARPSNRAALWWTQELQELVYQAQRLWQRHVQSGETLDHDQWLEAERAKKRKIVWNKRKSFWEVVHNATESPEGV